MAALCSERQLASVYLQLLGSAVAQGDGTRRASSGTACSGGGEAGRDGELGSVAYVCACPVLIFSIYK